MNVGVPDFSKKSYLKKTNFLKNSKVWGNFAEKNLNILKMNVATLIFYYSSRQVSFLATFWYAWNVILTEVITMKKCTTRKVLKPL